MSRSTCLLILSLSNRQNVSALKYAMMSRGKGSCIVGLGYQNGSMVDYSDIELLQMIGRAGRPGMEDAGCAVIMTTAEKEERYKTIVDGTAPIESW